MARNFNVLTFTFLLAVGAHAQLPVTNDPPSYGPFNAVLLADGDGLRKSMIKDDSVLRPDSPWSLYCWVWLDEPIKAPTLLAGVGELEEEYPRYLAADAGQITLWMGKDNSLSAPATLAVKQWQFLAVTFDGSEFHIYNNATKAASGTLALGSVTPVFQIAPAIPPTSPPFPPVLAANAHHFGGKLSHLTLVRRAMTVEEFHELRQQPADFAYLEFEEGSKPWPVQTRGQAGYRAPQDPSTMPHGNAPFSKPVAKPLPSQRPALQPDGENQWTIANGWKMIPAPQLNGEADAISQPSFTTATWLAATVPGTALTTLIDRGIYPDPDYGLNNLAIPESLNKQDYWYRNEFKAPKVQGGRFTLTFEGINYRASVFLNGKSLGTITGAFIRGVFDVTSILKPGETNVLVVRVSPPTHPGIPQEQSMRGGPGENGGYMCLDGPTFVATEGWDWIPAIRDRDTGIWQPVVLTASGGVKIGDAQVVTKLPLPSIDKADVEITVPLENTSASPVHGTLKASFDQTTVTKDILVAPGKSTVTLTPKEFSQLTVQNPRLWWPNGYGKQELYKLKLTFSEGPAESDSRQVRFGIREITYELSLLDSTGHLRRVDYSPTAARALHERVVDVSHDGMRETPNADPPPADWLPEWRPGWKQWVASFAPKGETSAAVHAVEDTRAAPYLILRVNGVRIACRGGNWGMDDSRKRVSRAHLEPFFRLHHDANVNMIRNWVGQNTEETFYELADEYGLLIWNDFWTSTQNYNIEPENPALFLENAADTIQRFRNHPSIAMWCGRNEGVPQPIISDGLAKLIDTLDGTRYYSPSSNQVNLQNSGPYKYQDPSLYYTTLNHGFSVETGTASLSTLEAFQAAVPKEDQWPINDTFAYHDWHYSGNGESAPFMAEVQREFGAGTSLQDFERKAQMLNYVNHRAIFEGMNAHLWAPNSGRLLWMTQPAWPSNMWQILSSDYDTQASFYGVKKACEPLHVQLDLSTFDVAVMNTTTEAQTGLTVSANVYSLDNVLLLHHEEKRDAVADAVNAGFKLELAPLLADKVVLVKLELKNLQGKVVSENLYWLAADSATYRQLNRLAAAKISVVASDSHSGNEGRIHVTLQNQGTSAALETKVTLLGSDGLRILPAYYSDNYVSLLPGETRELEIGYPLDTTRTPSQLAIRGWNVANGSVAIAESK